MTVDVVALVRVEVVSIVGVRVVQECVGSASGFTVERNPLTVTLSPSIFLVGLESVGRDIAGGIVVDLEILLHAGAVTTTVGQDPDGKGALHKGGGGDELGEVHFQ